MEFNRVTINLTEKEAETLLMLLEEDLKEWRDSEPLEIHEEQMMLNVKHIRAKIILSR